MGESKNIELLIQSHPPTAKRYSKPTGAPHSWMMMENKDDHLPSPSSSASASASASASSFDSNGKSTSEASSDLADDASSSPSASPLYGLYYDLITQLPIKRGLSKHYNGKSQSFACLSKVMSVEDLVKKERFCRRNMKACKSIGAGLDHKLPPTSPKPVICKKSSRNSTHVSLECHSTKRTSCSPRQRNLQF